MHKRVSLMNPAAAQPDVQPDVPPVAGTIVVRDRCILRYVPNAAKILRFHFCLAAIVLSTVAIASVSRPAVGGKINTPRK